MCYRGIEQRGGMRRLRLGPGNHLAVRIDLCKEIMKAELRVIGYQHGPVNRYLSIGLTAHQAPGGVGEGSEILGRSERSSGVRL